MQFRENGGSDKATKRRSVTFLPAREAVMWRSFLISLGFLTVALAGCDPEVLIAKSSSSDRGAYEVVALVAH
jgi:hypothetical protein